MTVPRRTLGPVRSDSLLTPVSPEHEWGPEQLWVGQGGPLDGEWIVQGCLHCNAFEIGPRSGGDCIGLILAVMSK